MCKDRLKNNKKVFSPAFLRFIYQKYNGGNKKCRTRYVRNESCIWGIKPKSESKTEIPSGNFQKRSILLHNFHRFKCIA